MSLGRLSLKSHLLWLCLWVRCSGHHITRYESVLLRGSNDRNHKSQSHYDVIHLLVCVKTMQKALGWMQHEDIGYLMEYYITLCQCCTQADSRVHQWDSLYPPPSVFSHVHLFVFTVVITTMVVWTVAMNMNSFWGWPDGKIKWWLNQELGWAARCVKERKRLCK